METGVIRRTFNKKDMMPLGLFKIQEDKLSNLIKEISSGNETALGQFYHDYGKMIFVSILAIVKSRESAEEVLQDVLMAIVTHKPDKNITNSGGWLFKVIQNLSKKKAKEDYSMETELLSENEDIPSTEDVSENIENSIDQIESLECLDPIEQQCIMLCIFNQMKLPDVAKSLGMPYKKVCNKYDYAVRKLRKYYEEKRE